MPELKSFPVFGDGGRIGTLAAPARFLDSRSEKTIHLDEGGELLVSADSLQVQQDGSFRLSGYPPQPRIAEAATNAVPTASDTSAPSGSSEKLYREGYVIEHVKIDRMITEPVYQQQVGDTLILPVVEEILVTEKRMILREEIRITRSRDPIAEVPSSVLT